MRFPHGSISIHDATQLAWFLGEGQTRFERSPCGAQLENADMFSHAIDPCEACPREMPGVMPDGDWCSECGGTGFSDPRKHKRPDEISAKPTHWHMQAGTAYAMNPEDEDLVRYAQVSRRLSRMPERFAVVLRLYYGDVGERWAAVDALNKGGGEGRILALFHLTAAGEKLVKRGVSAGDARLLKDMGVRADEIIANQAMLQKLKPDMNRGALLTAARADALVLLRVASEEWVSAA